MQLVSRMTNKRGLISLVLLAVATAVIAVRVAIGAEGRTSVAIVVVFTALIGVNLMEYVRGRQRPVSSSTVVSDTGIASE